MLDNTCDEVQAVYIDELREAARETAAREAAEALWRYIDDLNERARIAGGQIRRTEDRPLEQPELRHFHMGTAGWTLPATSVKRYAVMAINSEKSAELQQKCFDAGFSWEEHGQNVHNPRRGYLLLNSHEPGRITFYNIDDDLLDFLVRREFIVYRSDEFNPHELEGGAA